MNQVFYFKSFFKILVSTAPLRTPWVQKFLFGQLIRFDYSYVLQSIIKFPLVKITFHSCLVCPILFCILLSFFHLKFNSGNKVSILKSSHMPDPNSLLWPPDGETASITDSLSSKNAIESRTNTASKVLAVILWLIVSKSHNLFEL